MPSAFAPPRSAFESAPSRWTLVSLAIGALLALPILAVVLNVFAGGTEATWSHLWQTVLPEILLNTLGLCVGVTLGVMVFGVGPAWLVTMCRFPGQRFFEWALVLPLAVPAYVMAYTYTDFLQFVGPVQTALREATGWRKGDYWFPEIRSLGGAILMFSAVLYPYVYLLARNAFLERAGGMLEAARTLGLSPWASFHRVSLPLARPALAAGAALAMMETLADYGTVAYFGVPTFTTAIYRSWFSLGDRIAAAQLSAALLAFVSLVLLLERRSRGGARFHNTTGRQPAAQGVALDPLAAIGAMLACAFPLVLGFLLPAGLLLRMAFTEGDAQFGWRFLELARNSFTLAALTALLGVALALLLAYAARLQATATPRFVNRVVGLGYAIPGSVIAVGVLLPVTRLDNWLAQHIQALSGVNPGLLLTGGISALVFAYLVRFLALALQTVEASLAKIRSSMDDAARSLGARRGEMLRRVHLPLLRGSVWTAGLLVFVDVMKELPATLVMRPFNFDTLATQAYTLASDERLAEASTAALAIVAVGILPLLAVTRQIAAGVRRG
ncbi:Sulfate transport system permease protein CysW [Burkholderiales bacterium]|nr:Sulfate transport system permease protein CysW [Burkholderiales bacterium]